MAIFSPILQGEVIEEGSQGRRLIHFNTRDVLSELETIGYAPLPPYIKRKKSQLDIHTIDLERYQTVFAHKDGSIAAPTAGLHFTRAMLDSIRARDVEVIEISLDVGLATFQPVRVERVEHHLMLEERYTISEDAARKINAAKKEKRSVNWQMIYHSYGLIQIQISELRSEYYRPLSRRSLSILTKIMTLKLSFIGWVARIHNTR